MARERNALFRRNSMPVGRTVCPVLGNSALSFAKDIPDARPRPAMALFECQRYPIILDSCGQSAWFATISHPVVVHGAINVRVVRGVWPD